MAGVGGWLFCPPSPATLRPKWLQKRPSIDTGELRRRDIQNLFETELRCSVPTLTSRWREILACNDNTCGESKGQNSHNSLLGSHS